MAIFGISDLHLAKDIDKPMDVFGPSWDRYMERIEANWRATITDDDYVLIPGDVSWATYLNEVDKDFSFINSLPGTKLISRGNHDYWWTTLRKMENYLTDKSFTTMSFVQNRAVRIDDTVVSGTRGWILPNDSEFSSDDQRIFDRELARLDLCIKDMMRLDPEHQCKWILMMHYPPLVKSCMRNAFVDKITSSKIDLCVYGHLHGLGHRLIVEDVISDTKFTCIAADYLKFEPLKLE